MTMLIAAMNWQVIIPIAGVIAIAGAIIFGRRWYEKNRREALEQAATTAGLEFLPESPSVQQAGLEHFELFKRGRRGKMKNTMRGRIEDIELTVFDYRYTVGSGKNSSTYYQTVAIMTFDRLDLPRFTLKPEHMLHKLGSLVGMDDIDFSDRPEFSKRYYLSGEQPSIVRELFTPDVTDALSTRERIWLEASGPTIVFYRHSKRIKPQDLNDFIAKSFDIATIIASQT